MARDKLEKYLLIPRDFPNKAGKLKQIVETQKRLALELARTKQSDGVNKLLITVGESYDVANDLLDWMHKILQGVALDAEALQEGSKVRNGLELQNSIVQAYLDRNDEYVNSLKQKLSNVTTGTNTKSA